MHINYCFALNNQLQRICAIYQALIVIYFVILKVSCRVSYKYYYYIAIIIIIILR